MGQFDKFVEPATSDKEAVIPAGAISRKGLVIPSKTLVGQENNPGPAPTQMGTQEAIDRSFNNYQPTMTVAESPGSGATDNGGRSALRVPGESLMRGRQAARTRSKQRAAEVVAGVRETFRTRRADAIAGLATTTKRLDSKTGEVYDTEPGEEDYRAPKKANPVSRLLSKGNVRPGPSAVPADAMQGPLISAEDFERHSNPEKFPNSTKGETSADVENYAQELTHKDLTAGEQDFNTQQERLSTAVGGNRARRRSGADLRSVNGITYSDLDLRGSAKRGINETFPNLRENAKDRDFISQMGAEHGTIPASTAAPKPALEPESKDKQLGIINPQRSEFTRLMDEHAPEGIEQFDPAGKNTDEESSFSNVNGMSDEDAAKKSELTTAETEAETADNQAAIAAKAEAEVAKNFPKRPLAWHEQDLWDKEGNLKPEHDLSNPDTNPLATTTMREQTTPGAIFKSPAHEQLHKNRNKALADVRTKHAAYLTGALNSQSKQIRVGAQTAFESDMAKVERAHAIPEGGYFATGADAEDKTTYEEVPGVRTPKKPYVKPEVQQEGTVIPMRALNTDYNAGKSMAELEAEKKKNDKNVGGLTGTRQLDLGRETGKPVRGQTSERSLTDLARFEERNQELVGKGGKNQPHDDLVMALARSRAHMAGVPEHIYNHPNFSRSQHVRDAYIDVQSGNFGDDANAKADSYFGGRDTEANDRRSDAYQRFKQKDMFQKTREPGTGVTWMPGSKSHNIDPEETYFTASDGKHVPLSQTDHPDHPGFALEGSAVPFKGFTKEGKPLVHPQTGEDLHQGWHPYRVNGKRVMEYHDIPKDAIHVSDITAQGITTGESPTQTLGKLVTGQESKITLGGQAISLHPSLADEMKESPADKRHKKHMETGKRPASCEHCQKLSSTESREGAAEEAKKFIPGTDVEETDEAEVGSIPIPASKFAVQVTNPKTGKAKNVGVSKATRKTMRGITRDDSKGLLSANNKTEIPFSGKKEEKGYQLQRTNLADIKAAKDAGHITSDEAYELGVADKHFPGLKSKFTAIEDEDGK